MRSLWVVCSSAARSWSARRSCGSTEQERLPTAHVAEGTTASNSQGRILLSGTDRDGQSALGRRERTCPRHVVGAGGVVGVVEVENEQAPVRPQVCTFHRVEEVAGGGIRLLAARRVLEGNEEATPVSIVPEQSERVLLARKREPRCSHPGERKRSAGARKHV